jgi:hypothetical protein
MSMIGTPLVRTVRVSALAGPLVVPAEAPVAPADVEASAGGAR